MARLVDSDYLFARVVVVLGENLERTGMALARDIINEILNAPEVYPVKHGKWERFDDGHYCSVCKTMTYLPRNYCPECGAKMDEVDR